MTRTNGWAMPPPSRRFHYFVDGRSLCGHWMYLGACENDMGVSDGEDCKACTRKALKDNIIRRESDE